ncbi:hypothetical protein DPSP01_010955 [Paraphaeosphaeria sporulosa]|uniref:N-acetyltransferase domain-containing protein n=1 Tax=Paraphaeosphaeria sporulosa TaxID=1460663 RepID=A0A177D264_9PLEO|nr:uncharacterized protein CC84DRAFT_1212586 [Paraphaeosphaeria sporulosa]OAG13139.1 hypothetical protein CC84DRAFT_1212586 [Paraphaeosphaeria sporulosa]
MATVDFRFPGLAEVTLRPGTEADVPVMLRLMDERTEWLVAQGLTGQWGRERQSDQPRRVEGATKMAKSGGTWVAIEKGPLEDSEQVLGVVTVGDAASYVNPGTEPELYINYLITDPKRGGGRGLGGLLVEKAKALAKEKGVHILRLDCYAGGDGKLVRWYESQGFQKQEAFEEKGWPGQVLSMRL